MGHNVILEKSNVAGIVADLISDGHLQIRKIDDKLKYNYIGFFSEDRKQLEYFNKRIYRIFGIRGTIREWGFRKNGRSKACIVSNSNVVKILSKIGVPHGDKVSSQFKIPIWIKSGDREIQSSFIRRMMNCEGSIGYDKNSKRWEIRITMHKLADLENNGRKFLDDIRDILKNFEIETTRVFVNRKYTRPKDNKVVLSLTFKILRKNSILNYSKFIGFDSEYKKERLQKAIQWAINGSGSKELKPLA